MRQARPGRCGAVRRHYFAVASGVQAPLLLTECSAKVILRAVHAIHVATRCGYNRSQEPPIVRDKGGKGGHPNSFRLRPTRQYKQQMKPTRVNNHKVGICIVLML